MVAATQSAEYKQVTVLFADVVRSMDIAATVGMERLREIMADLANRCAAVVERYGGTVDKFTGEYAGSNSVIGSTPSLAAPSNIVQSVQLLKAHIASARS